MLQDKKVIFAFCWEYRLQRPTMKRRVAYLLLLEGESPGLGERQKVQIF